MSSILPDDVLINPVRGMDLSKANEFLAKVKEGWKL